MVTVAASAPVHNDSKFVFRTWINNTGWDDNVLCFITGLVNPLYSLGGLDGITVCACNVMEENMLIKAAYHGGNAKRELPYPGKKESLY